MRRRDLATVLVPLLALPVASTATVEIDFEVRARSGEVAPGTGGAIWYDVTTPTIDAQGRVAFTGMLEAGGDVDGSNDQGAWGPLGGDALALLMREGDAPPGLPAGRTIGGVTTPVVDALGRTLWQAEDDFSDDSLWRSTAGGDVELILQDRDLAPPDFVELLFLFPHQYALTAAGDVLASGTVFSRGQSVFRQDPSGTDLELLLQANQPIAGTTPGVLVSPGSRLVITNAWGEIAGEGSLVEGVGGVTVFDSSIVYGPDGAGGVRVAAREDDAAPGLGGARFWLFRDPAVDDLGRTVFVAALQPGVGGVTESDKYSLWQAEPDGTLSLLLRAGEPAPGYPPGAVLGPTFSLSDQTPEGELVVMGDVQLPGGGQERAIWVGDESGFELAVRPGEAAPGLPVPATFTAVTDASAMLDPRGWLVFEGRVDGGPDHDAVFCAVAGPGCAGNVLYAATPEGELAPIFHRGQAVEAAPGEVILSDPEWAYHWGRSDRGTSSFAPDGRFALALHGVPAGPPIDPFGYESAVVVVTLPESAAALQLVAGAAALALLRRARPCPSPDR